MAEATATAAGVFCWHEVNTKDVEATKKFYTELCGWEVEPFDMGGFTYNCLNQPGKPSFGGIMDASGPEWENVPPHWMGYINCDNVDASAEKVKELGGNVCVPPTDIPNVGRFSVVSDPTGGTFSLFTANEPMQLADTICWNELMTKDQDAAVKFYTGLFGYETEDMPIGDDGVYKVLKVGDKQVGGIFHMKGPDFENVPPHWMPYIGTDNVDAVAEKAKSLGATICQGPADIPNNVGRFVVLTDPTGAAISFYQPGQPCE